MIEFVQLEDAKNIFIVGEENAPRAEDLVVLDVVVGVAFREEDGMVDPVVFIVGLEGIEGELIAVKNTAVTLSIDGRGFDAVATVATLEAASKLY